MVDNKQNEHATAEAVDMVLKPSTPRQLGEEGLLVFWRDEIESGQREGLACIMSMCPHPECACQLVYIDGFVIGGNATKILWNQDGVHRIRLGGQLDLNAMLDRALMRPSLVKSLRGATNRPLADDLHLLAPVSDFDGHKASRMWRLVEADGADAVDRGVEPRVVMAEEADLWTDTTHQVIEPLSFADPPGTAPVPLEGHPGGGVVDQEHVNPAASNQCVDLVSRVVALAVGLKVTRPSRVVGWPITTTEATNRERLIAVRDVEPRAVA